ALGMLEPVEVSPRKQAPPGAPENTCWDRDDSPAVIETVTEQVELERSQTDADGQVTKPAIYQTETNHKIIKPREEAWFQTPCPEQMTPEFIASLQRALKARGHYRGEDHGRLDRWTRAGIRAYQKPQGLDSATLSLAAAQQMGLAVVDLPGRDPEPDPTPEPAPQVAQEDADRALAEKQEVAKAQRRADEEAELARQAELYREAEAARLAAEKAEAERLKQAQQAADEQIRAELAEKAAAYRQAEAARQAELKRAEQERAKQAQAQQERAEQARKAALEAEAAEARAASAARTAQETQAQATQTRPAAPAAQTPAQTDAARRAAELRQALEDEKRRIEATGRETLPISTESY
ncbi:MAG: peptidoglycan-binding protein, partial [Kangiellaceae bacterium]|nr:peptidoglycan-binding protein [Kangiellaceae bacterium]